MMLDLVPAGQHGPQGWARALLILGVGTMTAAWLALWFALFGSAAGVPVLLPGPLQELTVLGGALVAWRLVVSPLGQRWVRVLFTAATLLAAMLVVWALYYHAWVPLDPRWIATMLHVAHMPGRAHAMLGTGVTTLILWWMGGRIGASDLEASDVYRSFGIGLGGLFAGLIVAALGAGKGPLVGVMENTTLIFFAAALASLPLAQLTWVQARGKAAGAQPPPLDHHWAGIVGGAVAFVILLALFIVSSFSADLLGAAAAGLARLPDLLALLLTPLIVLGGFLVQLLVWLFHGLAGKPRAAHPPTLHLPTFSQLTHGQHGGAYLPPVLVTTAKGVALVVVALVVLLILSRAVTRLSGLRHDRAFEEERDSVWSREEAVAAWRALMSGLGRRLRRPARPRCDDERRPPRTIREAYRRLLRRGAALGHPRAAHVTPQEYLGHLRRIPIPDERDAALLTSAYMRVRYGDEDERPEDLEHAIHAWERLDRSLVEATRGRERSSRSRSGRVRPT